VTPAPPEAASSVLRRRYHRYVGGNRQRPRTTPDCVFVLRKLDPPACHQPRGIAAMRTTFALATTTRSRRPPSSIAPDENLRTVQTAHCSASRLPEPSCILRCVAETAKSSRSGHFAVPYRHFGDAHSGADRARSGTRRGALCAQPARCCLPASGSRARTKSAIVPRRSRMIRVCLAVVARHRIDAWRGLLPATAKAPSGRGDLRSVAHGTTRMPVRA
jgi:hypothetical protein